MLVAGFPAGAWATNCYVVASGPGEPCVVVDPGQKSMAGVRDILREHRLVPAAVILTHGHIDHAWSVAPLSAEFGVPAYIHPADRYRLVDMAGTSMAAARDQLMAMTEDSLELTEPDDVRPLPDGEPIELVGLTFTPRHAPGHTEGSVVFEVDDVMLSGDVLFAGSIGRTDLPGGDHAAMLASLRRVILPADDALTVLPGHGPQTTIGAERLSNPYLLALADEPADDGSVTGLAPRRTGL